MVKLNGHMETKSQKKGSLALLSKDHLLKYSILSTNIL